MNINPMCDVDDFTDRVNVDCAVIGRGISGVIVAKLLSNLGFKVALFGDNKSSTVSLAESLPASSIPIMRRLALTRYIQDASHFPCMGTVSAWGTSQLNLPTIQANYSDHGWKVNKHSLVEQIYNDLPVGVATFGRVFKLEKQLNGWLIYAQHSEVGKVQVSAQLVVDASGRQGYLTRALNITRHTFDKLLAFVVNVPQVEPNLISHPVLVESQKHCWGLVSKINKQQNMLAIFSNPSSPDFDQYKKFKNWQHVCRNSVYFKQFLPTQHNANVSVVNASSHICSQLVGDNWLMVGDAAMAFDPLSSHGMSTGMYMAEKASDAIYRYFSGDTESLKEYAHKMSSIYNTYLNELVQHYKVEQRWKHCAFWQSKQNIQMKEECALVS